MTDLETWKARTIRTVIDWAAAGFFITALAIVATRENAGEADAHAAAQSSVGDVYSRLRPFPTPFTAAEKQAMHVALADADAALIRAHEATDDDVARLERLAR